MFCYLRMKQLFVSLRVDAIFARLKNFYKWQTIGEIERCNNMYLLTEWEGRTGKYLARGHGVRTERSEVRAP